MYLNLSSPNSAALFVYMEYMIHELIKLLIS